MWWIETIARGDLGNVEPGPIAVFRIVFAVSCLLKFAIETLRGHFWYFEEDSFLYTLDSWQGRLPLISPVVYRCLYVVKHPLALCLALGVCSQLASILLFVWFVVEARIYFKFHVSLFALVAFVLGLGPAGHKTYALLGEGPMVVDGFQQTLLVLTFAIVYLATALRKLRSPHYLSGKVIYETLRYLNDEGPMRKYADGYYPRWFRAQFVLASDEVLNRRWGPLMRATVLLHVAIPVLMSFSETWWVGASLAVLTHGAYTLAYPITLGHFSLVMIASCLVFADPATLSIYLPL
ncbi:MAG: hypothetical protein R3F62_29485 [Planctomycetota bacterium]